MLRWLVAIVVLGSATASAEPSGDVIIESAKQLLASQVAAIGAGDAKAFAAAFGADSFAFLPTAAGEGRGRRAIEAAAKIWLAGVGKVTVKADPARCDAIWYSVGAWCSTSITATAGATTTRWRMLIVIESIESAHDQILAEHLSEAIDDKAALAAARAGKLPRLPALPAQPSDDGALDANFSPLRIGQLAKLVADSPAAVVIGSAPNEFVVGKSAVAAKLSAWKSLKLSLGEQVFGRSATHEMFQLNYTAAHLTATFMVAGAPVTMQYRALTVGFEPPAGNDIALEAVHFSVATH